MEKNAIRSAILEQRALLSRDKVEENSSKIIERIQNTNEYKKCSSLMCYIDFKNEVLTKAFLRVCLERGIKVSVPVITSFSPTCKKMIASRISNIEADLEQNFFGIFEPKKEIVKEVKPEELDMIVLPGLAFDMDKNRLGFGAGFYDRFLEHTKEDCFKLGIAYDFQVIDKVPVDKYDKKMNSVITEKRVII